MTDQEIVQALRYCGSCRGTCLECPAHTREGDCMKLLATSADLIERLTAENAVLREEGVARLRELVEADKDGRCVVLPCKVGDVLYAAETDPIIPLHVMAVAIYLEVEGEAYGDYERISNIGKTVFLTREEAELALKKEKEKFNVDVSQT